MASQDNWGDFKFEDTQPNSFLSLRNNIKEHICRFLPERKDLYQACLIHPQWRIAAQSVLWERVQFEKPENLRHFLDTISSNNKAALLVKSVQLVFIDHDEATPFPPIAKSKLERHRPSTLSNLGIAAKIASVCENITHMAIYGYNLGLRDIEQLSAYARNLKSLVIIGAPVGVPANLNTLLPRLTSLRLDGPFGLTPAWANVFAQKAIHLSCLQLSLEGIQAATLDNIYASGLHLTELTLTEAIHLNDAYVHRAFKSFPRLRRFRVESCVKVTSVSLAHGVLLCPNLLDLEIRAQQAVSGADSNNNLNNLYDVLGNAQDSAVLARPTRLVLQNMDITDEELHALSRFFTHTQYLGISGCRALTNACFQEFVIAEDFRFLRSLSIQHCPLIDSSLLGLIIKSHEICQSLMYFYFDACGVVDLHDIYQLCHHCYQDNLRQVKLVHYEHLADTVLGAFNEAESRRTLLLTRRSIDALAHSRDPTLTKPVPDNVMLTGKQLVRLAGLLNMAVSDLEDLIAQVAEQDEQIVPCDDTASTAPRASHDRLAALRASSRMDHRPSTPAVWSYDEVKNGSIVSPPKNRFEDLDSLANQTIYQDELAYQDEPGFLDENEEEDDDEDDEEGEDNEDDEDGSFKQDNDNEASFDEDPNEDDQDVSSQSDKSQSSWNNKSTAQHEFQPEGNLGGWGALSTNNWGTPSTSTSSAKASLKDVQAEQQQQQQQQQKQQYQQHQQQQQQQQPSFTDQNYWTSYKADTYENEWRQTPLEHHTAHNRKNFTAGHYRNAPQVMESDGWGQPKNNIPWNDPHQGYERSVIEEQQRTDFWNQPAPGQWVLASGPSASKQNNAATTPTPSTSHHHRPAKSHQARNKSRKVDSSSSDEDQYNYTATTTIARGAGGAGASAGGASAATATTQRNSFHGVVPSKTRPRSDSVVSSDESVNWDQDDNRVQIKVHADFPPLQKPAAATPAASPVKNRDQQSTTHWNNAAEWQAKSARNTASAAAATTSAAHYAPTPPAAATTTMPTTRFSRRATTPRNNSSNNINTANNNNNNTVSENVWWDYAKAPDQTPSTPVRKVAPPPPSPQKPLSSSAATMAAPAPTNAVVPAFAAVSTTPPPAAATPLLIDTENGDSSKKPARTDEIWSNLNKLVIDSFVPTNKTTTLLKPSNTSASPSVVDLFDMPDTSADDDIKEFRFGERIAGTITDAELEREKAAAGKDNLVSFDSDSTPDEDQAEPKKDKGKPANFMEDSFASLDFSAAANTTTTTTTAPTTSSILSPTPSKTPVLSPLIHGDNVSRASSAPSQPLQAQSVQVQSSRGQPSPAQSFQVPSQTQVQPEQQQQQQPTETTATENAAGNATDSSTPPTTKSPADILKSRRAIGHRPIALKFLDKPDLIITQDDDIPSKCRAYCIEHNIPNMVEIAIAQAENNRTARITRRILKRSGKKKATTSNTPPQ